MKRILSVLTAMTLLLGVAFAASSAASADGVMYGDVDGNGKINNRDLGMLQRYLNEDDTVVIDPEAADVKYDGKINNRDLGWLQRYLNDDATVTLGPEKPEEPDTPDPPDVPNIPDVPAAALPEVGYDLDGKGRILVQSISQEGYVVTVTLTNTSNKWMTEETSYVEYTCTDAEGNVLVLNDKYYGTLYFGMLEAKETDIYTITLPEGTAKLEFGTCRIVYWSQWA
ncbi:MAG: hypothetical protein IJN04_03390 [Clostridia bacterium]|nr:hypothetical protein [Clostridia bacterium]